MRSLAAIRIQLARTVGWRIAAAWLVLALVTAGMPRWEMHAHAIDTVEHHHHTGTSDHHDHDAAQSASGDASSVSTMHVHDAVSLTAAPCGADGLRLHSPPPARLLPLLVLPAPVGTAWPPPYRPPIV